MTKCPRPSHGRCTHYLSIIPTRSSLPLHPTHCRPREQMELRHWGGHDRAGHPCTLQRLLLLLQQLLLSCRPRTTLCSHASTGCCKAARLREQEALAVERGGAGGAEGGPGAVLHHGVEEPGGPLLRVEDLGAHHRVARQCQHLQLERQGLHGPGGGRCAQQLVDGTALAPEQCACTSKQASERRKTFTDRAAADVRYYLPFHIECKDAATCISLWDACGLVTSASGPPPQVRRYSRLVLSENGSHHCRLCSTTSFRASASKSRRCCWASGQVIAMLCGGRPTRHAAQQERHSGGIHNLHLSLQQRQTAVGSRPAASAKPSRENPTTPARTKLCREARYSRATALHYSHSSAFSELQAPR
jgi:hypothetical protein